MLPNDERGKGTEPGFGVVTGTARRLGGRSSSEELSAQASAFPLGVALDDLTLDALAFGRTGGRHQSNSWDVLRDVGGFICAGDNRLEGRISGVGSGASTGGLLVANNPVALASLAWRGGRGPGPLPEEERGLERPSSGMACGGRGKSRPARSRPSEPSFLTVCSGSSTCSTPSSERGGGVGILGSSSRPIKLEIKRMGSSKKDAGLELACVSTAGETGPAAGDGTGIGLGRSSPGCSELDLGGANAGDVRPVSGVILAIKLGGSISIGEVQTSSEPGMSTSWLSRLSCLGDGCGGNGSARFVREAVRLRTRKLLEASWIVVTDFGRWIGCLICADDSWPRKLDGGAAVGDVGAVAIGLVPGVRSVSGKDGRLFDCFCLKPSAARNDRGRSSSGPTPGGGAVPATLGRLLDESLSTAANECARMPLRNAATLTLPD